MDIQRREIRIPALRVLVAMLLLITPICILALVAVAQANNAVERTVGTHFRSISEATASEISAFVHDRVTDVGALARDYTIIEAVESGNRSYSGRSEEQIANAIRKVESEWNTPAAAPLANGILSSRASQVLRRHRDFDRRLLRITVTDARGATVAGTHKSLDYYQADEDYWQKIHADGRGTVSVTDVLYDDVTKAYYVGIGVPILEDQTNRFLGTVDALVDVGVIFAVTQRMRFGTTATLLLVKDDGTIIAGPGLVDPLKTKSAEFAEVLEQGDTNRSSGYLVATAGERQVIGFADTGLKRDYGSLNWYVVSAQTATEAFAPVRPVVRMLVLMALLGLAAVTLFGVYLYFHQGFAYEHIGRVEERSATGSSQG